jgi:orotidine-5'-phosphate decarboxylase
MNPLLVTSPVIVALDYPSMSEALAMARCLDPSLCRVKVGKELFTEAGPQGVEALHRLGFEVFLDLKFHDIPNTTAKAVAAAARLGVWMVNVHASGGRRMMAACRDELAQVRQPPWLIAVTVLTSMSETDLAELGQAGSMLDRVRMLASLARDSGMDGVVCSAHEVSDLSARFGSGFKLVTPGIRPADAAADDQKRTMTPLEARAAGSHFLVIGRPITRAPDPLQALQSIIDSLA